MSNVGNIPEEIADDMASIADYFLRMEGISLVVVWGIIGDDVRISARSTDLSTPLEEFMRQKFGPDSGAKLDPAGRGEGGALLDLDLGFWMTDKNQELVEKMVEQRLEQLMFGEETFPQQNESIEPKSNS
jgi:nanoRNase/pAp phosphatase (c-di-AMP/oligoRNAs hydrolase)